MNTIQHSPTQAAAALDQFDLLPPSFRYQIRVQQVLHSWLTIIVALIAVLIGVIVATTYRVHRNRQLNERIASAAIPLMELRSDVIELREENNQRSQWCRSVEAARPDDSALQTLAAVAVASQNGNGQIIIDSIHLRLPIEFPASATKTPDWATPQITITARLLRGDAVGGWVDRLNSFDRIESASIVAANDHRSQRGSDWSPVRASVPELTPGGPTLTQVQNQIDPLQLTATPLATRVVP